MSQSPRFTWKSPDGVNHDFEMTMGEISIGRAPTCDIIITNDQMVSRRHAIVRRQGTTLTIIDLGSSNGTLVNGVEIHESATLKDNDKLTIGDQDIAYVAVKETSAVAGAPTFGTAPSPFYTPSPAPSPFDQGNGHSFGVNAKPPEQSSGLSYSDAPQWGTPVPTPAPMPIPVPTPVAEAPRQQDAASLLSSMQALHSQLEERIAAQNAAAGTVRTGIQATLAKLDAALAAAQTSSQQAALVDLQQVATNVIQTPMMDQVANFARRASEIREVVSAHQQLLDALNAVRQQLTQTLNNNA